MAYLGNRPAEAYSAFQKQDFSTSATTSYTLDHPVANQNEIALFINFVRQEPTAAYTASGTTLTLTSATASSDDMYCIYLGKAVQTVNPPSGSVGSSQVAASIITGQTAETSIATDDLILLSDTSASGALKKMTRANFVSGIGNTPGFSVRNTSDQTFSANTITKATFNTEDYDSDSAFTSDKFTVPSGAAGKYFIGFRFGYRVTSSDFTEYLAHVYLNGSEARISARQKFTSSYMVENSTNEVTAVGIMDLSVGDYIELFLLINTGGGTPQSTANQTEFFGFKIG